MFRSVRARLSAFRADTRGVVLYLVALLMVPFVVLLGVAIDFGQLLLAKNQLASAIDAAALDIGATPGLTQAQAEAQANAYVSANFSTQYPSATLSPLTVVLQSTGNTPCPQAPAVSITAKLTTKTAFLQVIGYKTLSAKVETCVTSAANKLEVVLVLDNTASMEQMYGTMKGIDGVKQAATTLVNTLFASSAGEQFVKVGIVPFTGAVNIANPNDASISKTSPPAWIDNSNAAGSLSQEAIDVPAGTGLVDFAKQLSDKTGNASWAWGGCVRQRNEPYDLQDVAPNASNPDTLFTPFFAPDEPDGASFSPIPTAPGAQIGDDCTGTNIQHANSWLCDLSCWQSGVTVSNEALESSYDELAANEKCITRYGSPKALDQTNFLATNGSAGPNYLCTVQPIIRLTNKQNDILNEINAMYAQGNTVIPAGLMWGWHLLSPNGPFNDGVPYSNSDTIKVIILVTDGDNNIWKPSNGQLYGGFNKSVFSAYGYGKDKHLQLYSVPVGVYRDVPNYTLDQKELQLCENIKAVKDAKGKPGRILLYTIAFGNVSEYSQGLLQQCATNTSTYFNNPTSDDLVATFQKIATGLSKLRIAK
jgi:Flp pilus assembly protein TadG